MNETCIRVIFHKIKDNIALYAIFTWELSASSIYTPNLLTNYPTKLHKIKNYVYEYRSQTYLSNFRCIIIIGLEFISHFANKHNTYFSQWMKLKTLPDMCVFKERNFLRNLFNNYLLIVPFIR